LTLCTSLFRACARRLRYLLSPDVTHNPRVRVEKPLPVGSHRYHEWRLSTPYLITLTRLKMAFVCMKIHHTTNTAFSPFIVFAKAQGIVKAKHRFLVQHARYSLTPWVDPHVISL
jgi:hypothetical protein